MLELLQKRAEGGRVDIVDLRADNRFWAIAKALVGSNYPDPRGLHVRPILALDPGETTGLALWNPDEQNILLCQLETPDIPTGYDKLWGIINYLSLSKPSLAHVRYEDYRVYGHMTEQHSFSHLHTARLIGAVEVACHLAQVRWSCCLAIHAKTFWTDEKLKLCGLYNPGLKHARDAERHLLRYMGEPSGNRI